MLLAVWGSHIGTGEFGEVDLLAARISTDVVAYPIEAKFDMKWHTTASDDRSEPNRVRPRDFDGT